MLNEQEDDATTPRGDRNDVLERSALRSRTVLLFGTIDDRVAHDTVQRLMILDHASADPITMIVSSPGGHVESGDAIHNAVRFIAAPVTMIGSGWVGSAATHVHLATVPVRRLCMPHTRFLIHQPSGGIGGKGSDIAIQAKEILLTRERIAGVIARETGQPLRQVLSDIDRDHWLSAEDAVSYGLVSRIVERATEV